MAIVIYPSGSKLLERNTSTNPAYSQVVFTTAPQNLVIYFDTGSNISSVSASTLQTTASQALTASVATSASYALTASFALNGGGGGGTGLGTGSTYPFTSSWAVSSSYAINGGITNLDGGDPYAFYGAINGLNAGNP